MAWVWEGRDFWETPWRAVWIGVALSWFVSWLRGQDLNL
jgi:hypothetical protein